MTISFAGVAGGTVVAADPAAAFESEPSVIVPTGDTGEVFTIGFS